MMYGLRGFGVETPLPLPLPQVPGLVTEEQCQARIAAAVKDEARLGLYRALGVGVVGIGVGVLLRGLWR